MCSEDQPAASHTSCRDIPDNKAYEAAILLVKWALTAKGEVCPLASYAREIASTILLILCLDAGVPHLGDVPKDMNN